MTLLERGIYDQNQGKLEVDEKKTLIVVVNKVKKHVRWRFGDNLIKFKLVTDVWMLKNILFYHFM